MNIFHSNFFRRSSSTIFLLSLFMLTLRPALALNNGVARTPPMGWNPWNTYKANINETIMKEMADKLVSTGLANAGYKYLNIDNGWYASPNASLASTTNFPSGIKALADYVHSKGLKLGIYTGREAKRQPVTDANTWASWGIDYVKHDAWDSLSTDTIFAAMSKAILATKRPMVYSVHFKDRAQVFGDPKIVNMWRFTNDLVPFYNRVAATPSWGVTTVDILDTMARVASKTGPGCWADADMLMVEQGTQTLEEWKTAFAISVILPSALILSADLRKTPPEIMDVYLNAELIAVNQDTVSRSWKVRDDGAQDVWARKLADSSTAVVFFNTSTAAKTMAVTWAELNMLAGNARVRNLWTKQDVGMSVNSYSVSVPAHATAFLKITPERFVTAIGKGHSDHAKVLPPEFDVRTGKGVLQVSLKQFSPNPLRVQCILSNLAGERIASGQWTSLPGSTEAGFLKVPSSCKNGMYILSVRSYNQATNAKSEIQKKVFIKN